MFYVKIGKLFVSAGMNSDDSFTGIMQFEFFQPHGHKLLFQEHLAIGLIQHLAMSERVRTTDLRVEYNPCYLADAELKPDSRRIEILLSCLQPAVPRPRMHIFWTELHVTIKV